MLSVSAAVLALSCGLGTSEGPTSVTPDAFRAWFDSASRGDLRIPEAVERRARGYRYVFVGGFRGEAIGGYFAQNARELRALGVPRSAIHFVYPSSGRTVEANREAVADEVCRAAKEGPESIVVVGHSRGACDALAFALGHPEFVRDRVAALFLVQGPFGGSALADYALGEGTPLDRRLPPGPRLICHLLGRVERAVLARGGDAGLPGMTRKASRAYWAVMLASHAEAIPIVGPKVYYIESIARPNRLRLVPRAFARYLGTYFGPNDGVVVRGDQTLPGLGTPLADLDAGHADLTRRGLATREGRRARRALVSAIVMAVGGGASADLPPSGL